MGRVIVIIAVLATLGAQRIAGQDGFSNVALSQPSLTVGFLGCSLEVAALLLSELEGIEIRIAADVPPSSPLRRRFVNAPFQEVFAFVLDSANADYRIVDSKTIEITKKPIVPKP